MSHSFPTRRSSDLIELTLEVTDAVGDQAKEHDQHGGLEDAGAAGASRLKVIDDVANDHGRPERRKQNGGQGAEESQNPLGFVGQVELA